MADDALINIKLKGSGASFRDVYNDLVKRHIERIQPLLEEIENNATEVERLLAKTDPGVQAGRIPRNVKQEAVRKARALARQIVDETVIRQNMAVGDVNRSSGAGSSSGGPWPQPNLISPSQLPKTPSVAELNALYRAEREADELRVKAERAEQLRQRYEEVRSGKFLSREDMDRLVEAAASDPNRSWLERIQAQDARYKKTLEAEKKLRRLQIKQGIPVSQPRPSVPPPSLTNAYRISAYGQRQIEIESGLARPISELPVGMSTSQKLVNRRNFTTARLQRAFQGQISQDPYFNERPFEIGPQSSIDAMDEQPGEIRMATYRPKRKITRSVPASLPDPGAAKLAELMADIIPDIPQRLISGKSESVKGKPIGDIGKWYADMIYNKGKLPFKGPSDVDDAIVHAQQQGLIGQGEVAYNLRQAIWENLRRFKRQRMRAEEERRLPTVGFSAGIEAKNPYHLGDIENFVYGGELDKFTEETSGSIPDSASRMTAREFIGRNSWFIGNPEPLLQLAGGNARGGSFLGLIHSKFLKKAGDIVGDLVEEQQQRYTDTTNMLQSLSHRQSLGAMASASPNYRRLLNLEDEQEELIKAVHAMELEGEMEGTVPLDLEAKQQRIIGTAGEIAQLRQRFPKLEDFARDTQENMARLQGSVPGIKSRLDRLKGFQQKIAEGGYQTAGRELVPSEHNVVPEDFPWGQMVEELNNPNLTKLWSHFTDALSGGVSHPDLVGRADYFRRLWLTDQYREALPEFFGPEMEQVRQGQMPSIISPYGVAAAKIKSGRLSLPSVKSTVDNLQQAMAELLGVKQKDLPPGVKSEFGEARTLIDNELFNQIVQAQADPLTGGTTASLRDMLLRQRANNPKYGIMPEIAKFAIGQIPSPAMDPQRLATRLLEQGLSPEATAGRLTDFGKVITELNYGKPVAGPARKRFADVFKLLKKKGSGTLSFLKENPAVMAGILGGAGTLAGIFHGGGLDPSTMGMGLGGLMMGMVSGGGGPGGEPSPFHKRAIQVYNALVGYGGIEAEWDSSKGNYFHRLKQGRPQSADETRKLLAGFEGSDPAAFNLVSELFQQPPMLGTEGFFDEIGQAVASTPDHNYGSIFLGGPRKGQLCH